MKFPIAWIFLPLISAPPGRRRSLPRRPCRRAGRRRAELNGEPSRFARIAEHGSKATAYPSPTASAWVYDAAGLGNGGRERGNLVGPRRRIGQRASRLESRLPRPCSWVDVLLIGPFPGYVQLVGESADATAALHRLDPVHGRWRAAELAGLVRTALGGGRGMVGRHHPIRRHAVLQPHDVPAMHTALTSPEYDKSLSGDPIGAGRSAFSSRARSPTAPRRVMDGCRARRRGMVAAGSQPARLHLLRNLGGCRLRRSVDRVDARPGGGQLEHVAGRGMLPGLCARHLAHRQGLEDATRPAAP